MTPAEQRAELMDRGYLRLRGVFDRAQAAAMEDLLWATLGRRYGVRREDPGSWQVPLGLGLQSIRSRRVFEPIGGPALRGALDALIGPGRWEPPKHWGQLLVSFPVQPGASRTRANWHTDFPYSLPPDRIAGALVLIFVGEVPPRSGGTLVLEGSPRLVARHLEARPHLRERPMKVTRRALLQSDPWLRAIEAPWTEEDWAAQLPTDPHTIAGVPVRIVELTGEPGDVVIGHPWLLHCGSPNRGERPRFMRVQRIRAARAPGSR